MGSVAVFLWCVTVCSLLWVYFNGHEIPIQFSDGVAMLALVATVWWVVLHFIN